jgi:adenosylhomocysteine nucleosidase
LNGLGIVAALAAESRPLGAAPRGYERPTPLADGTLLILAGMGPAAATEGARRLAAAGVRALLSWGMAGGLDPLLAPGTLVLPMEVMSPEGRLFGTAREWRERVSCAMAAHHPVCSGRLLTCHEALSSPAAKSLAFRRTAAIAVDMESSAVAEVAAAARLPFLAVRAIVDTAADEVPRAALAALTAGTGGLRVGRLLGALALAPGELPALLRLGGRYRSARRALFAVARSGALAPTGLRAAAGSAVS